MKKLNPYLASSLIHFFLFSIGFSFFFHARNDRLTYEVPINLTEIQDPKMNLKIKEESKIVVKSINKNETSSTKNIREVFGANKLSYTDEEINSREGVEFKRGNTLTKEADDLKLEDSDMDSLPDPVEEYLVSEMPTLKKEVRPQYPEEARKKRIEGSVVFDLLIDQSGFVRKAEIISGDEIFFKVGLDAIKRFIFSPAKLESKPVAIKIRYTLRFQLEY